MDEPAQMLPKETAIIEQGAPGAPDRTMPGVEAALAACPADVQECLRAVMSGGELGFEQGLKLATAEGTSLVALVAVADQLRGEAVGDVITYVVNRNLNFTNVCFVGCSFCGFARGPGAVDAYTHSTDEVVRRAKEAWERGATEVCIQGGLPKDLDGFFYRKMGGRQTGGHHGSLERGLDPTQWRSTQ